MNTRNSTNVVWINTVTHRCTVMEEDVRYPLETMDQGRRATNPIPRYSVLAGKPVQGADSVRGMFWRSYFYSVAGIAVCSAILAYWPK